MNRIDGSVAELPENEKLNLSRASRIHEALSVTAPL